MPQYARRVAAFPTTVFTEINELARQYDAVNLGQGRPDFDAPPRIIEAAAAALHAGMGVNQYAPAFGVPALRNAIAEHARRFRQLDVDPDKGVLVTAGATEGLFSSILGMVDPGEEVILIEPYFDTYRMNVEIANATPVFVPMRPPDWTFNADELRAAFNERTRAIVINTPNNPTGRVFSRDELALIADLCQQHDVIAISDEVYEHLTYDGHEHISLATLPGMFERTLTVSSAAKTFSVTGWKIGWVMGPPELVQGVWRIHQNTTFAINHPSQIAVATGLHFDDAYFADYRAMYEQKRALLLEALSEAGLQADAPQGAFYIMADFSGVFDGDDIAFAKHLIEQIGVACIPPSAFFDEAHKDLTRHHVRFAYCKDDDTLQAAAERLVKLK